MTPSAYLGLAGIGVSAFGGVLNSFGASRSAKEQASYARAAAYQTYLNSTYTSALETYNAGKVAESAGIAEYNAIKDQRSRQASMEAAIAGNNVALEGTAIDMLSEQARADATNNEYMMAAYRNQSVQHTMNAQSIMNEGKSRMHGLLDQASMITAAGRKNRFTGLLSTAGDAGFNLYRFLN